MKNIPHSRCSNRCVYLAAHGLSLQLVDCSLSESVAVPRVPELLQSSLIVVAHWSVTVARVGVVRWQLARQPSHLLHQRWRHRCVTSAPPSRRRSQIHLARRPIFTRQHARIHLMSLLERVQHYEPQISAPRTPFRKLSSRAFAPGSDSNPKISP